MHPLVRSISLDNLGYDNSDRDNFNQAHLSRSALCLENSSKGSAPNSTFVLLRPGLYLALYCKKQAELMGRHELSRKQLVLVKVARHEKAVHRESTSTPASLVEMYKFNMECNAIRRQNPEDAIIFYTGLHALHQGEAIFLLGCFLLMSYSYSTDRVQHIFQCVGHNLLRGTCEFPVAHYWQALELARNNVWVDFRENFDSLSHDGDCIDIDEHLHYAR
jgi:hypothetical protein